MTPTLTLWDPAADPDAPGGWTEPRVVLLPEEWDAVHVHDVEKSARRHVVLDPCADPEGRPDEQPGLVAARWRDLRASGVPIISTWIDESGLGETASFRDLWERNVSEASGADAVIAYSESGEVLKGALVEIGAALAAGRPVFWVGPTDGQTVVYHRLVRVCDTLAEALVAVRARLEGRR